MIGKDTDKNKVPRFLYPTVCIVCTLENTSHFILSKQYLLPHCSNYWFRKHYTTISTTASKMVIKGDWNLY